MREHMGLYRGKRIDNAEWVEGNLIYRRVWMSDVWVIRVCDNGFDSYEEYEVDPDTIGECTGLKDKNGKLIWEGDICRNTKTGEIVFVAWHGTMAGFVWSKQKEKSHLFDFGELFRAFDKYEIIGNIHDNKELLKGGDA